MLVPCLLLALQSSCLDAGDPTLVHPSDFFADPYPDIHAVHLPSGDVWAYALDRGPGGDEILVAMGFDAATGAWQPPVQLAPEVEIGGFPQACVAADGTVFVAAVTYDYGAEYRADLSVWTLPVGGAWSGPEVIDSYVFGGPFIAGGSKLSTLDIAAHADGAVVAAWAVDSATDYGDEESVRVCVRSAPAASGTFGSPVAVTPPHLVPESPTFVASPNGAVLQLFVVDRSDDVVGDPGIYHLTFDAPSGAFSAAALVPGSEDHNYPFGTFPFHHGLGGAADDGGGAVVFWSENTPGTILQELHGARFDGAAWLADELLYDGLQGGVWATYAQRRLAVTPSGEFLFAGLIPGSAPPAPDVVPIHWRPGTGFWVGPTLIAPTGNSADAAIAVYDGDRALLLTTDFGEPVGFAYNGIEWDQVGFEVNLPTGSFGSFHTSVGPEGVLLLALDEQWPFSGDDQFRATWIHGTTAFAELEGAAPGAAGTPRLTGACDLDPGVPVTFQLTAAAPSAPTILAVGTERADLPLFGGLLIPLPTTSLTAVTDVAGELALTLPWPAGLPSGASVYFQAWIVDATAAAGVAASNGLSGVQR